MIGKYQTFVEKTLIPLLTNKRFVEKNNETQQIELRDSTFLKGERVRLANMLDGTEKYERMHKLQAGSSVTKAP
jgi:hypothetical protein